MNQKLLCNLIRIIIVSHNIRFGHERFQQRGGDRFCVWARGFQAEVCPRSHGRGLRDGLHVSGSLLALIGSNPFQLLITPFFKPFCCVVGWLNVWSLFGQLFSRSYLNLCFQIPTQDITTLTNDEHRKCVIHQSACPLRQSLDGFAAGFSCTSYSLLNNKSKQNATAMDLMQRGSQNPNDEDARTVNDQWSMISRLTIHYLLISLFLNPLFSAVGICIFIQDPRQCKTLSP